MTLKGDSFSFWDAGEEDIYTEQDGNPIRVDSPFPWVKCESCKKQYRLISSLCPYCGVCNHRVANIILSNGQKQCGCCLKMIEEEI